MASSLTLMVVGGSVFVAFSGAQVMHPWNPFAPTMHFNYRYFETDAPAGESRVASQEPN